MSITKISAAMTDLDGAVTINNSGADADFIVESDGNANAIFVNAGDDRVTFFNSTTVNAASGTDDGASHYSDGRTDISRASGQPLNLRRRTDDGIVTNFFKEASGTVTDVGAISTWSSNLAVGRQNCALLFDDDVNRIKPASVTSSGARDNVIDLGDPSHRFNDVWIGGGIHIGGTGDANKLDLYEEGSFTPVIQGTTQNGAMTSTTAYGKYTRVGNLITANFYVGGTHNGNYTGQVLINGFPEAVGDSGQPSPNCYTASYNVDNNGESLFGSGNPGTTYFLMYMTGTGTAWGALNWGTSTMGASGTTVYFTGTYQYRV